MDPITILSVACAAGQFVSFGFDLVKGSVERYRSIEGAEKRHLAMTEDAKRLSDLINALSRESSQSATFTLYQSKSPLALKLDFITYECYAVADELRELVSSTSVQPSEKRRMLQSIKMTIRSVRKDSAITNLHNRLRTLRENVDTCMMMVLCTETAAIKENLSDLMAYNKTRLNKKLDIAIAEIRATDTIQDTSRSTAEEIVHDVRRLQAVSSYMKALGYVDMGLRESGVSKAHDDTFLWIFDNSIETDVGCASKNLPAENEKIHQNNNMLALSLRSNPYPTHRPKPTGFVPWLRSGQGIYWITGKLGSGKSTLMKFVMNHKVADDALQEWKGTSRLLVKASHFFWSAGSDLQKSEEGFLRSLLYQILKRHPQLYQHGKKTHAFSPIVSRDLSIDDSWNTLFDIVKSESAVAGEVKFLFFIDGLDECAANHYELMGNIKELAQLPYVKVCAGSRDWAVFSRHFMFNNTIPCTKIHVHEYTYGDIYQYTKDNLDGEQQPACFAPTAEERQDLVKTVVDRAQGVFLWVKLVCQNLLRGYVSADSWSTLLHRLDSLPTDLEPYFQKMLDDIDPAYRDESCMLLSTMLVRRDREQIYCSYFGDFCQGKQDWNFRIHADSWKPLPIARIKARGADLLNVNVDDGTVSFIHRTVFDFLHDTKKEWFKDIAGKKSFFPRLYWARQIICSNISKDPAIRKIPPGNSLQDAFSLLRFHEYQTGMTDEVMLDCLDDVFEGKTIGGVQWSKGTTLAMAFQHRLSRYTSKILDRQDTTLPSDLFTPLSVPKFFRMPWVTSNNNCGRNLKLTSTAMLLYSGCLMRHHDGYNLADNACSNVNTSGDMLNLLKPFGAPTREPINWCLYPRSENAWHFVLSFYRYYPRNSTMDHAVENGFTYLIKLMTEENVCDHFFDKRTHLPHNVLNDFQTRKAWDSTIKILDLRRKQSPWPHVSHWRCYFRGVFSILYLATVAPPTLPSDRIKDDSIGSWFLRCRHISAFHWYPEHEPAPIDRPWWSHLPQHLDSFCKLMWPATHLLIASVIYFIIRTSLPEPRDDIALVVYAIKQIRWPITLPWHGQGYASVILITYLVFWTTSVYICVHRRHQRYLVWFHREKAARDPKIDKIDRRRRPRELADVDIIRKRHARQDDAIKMAAEKRVRALSVAYFASFFLLWIMFG